MKSALWILVALIVSGLLVILLAGKNGEAPPELELQASSGQEPVVHRSEALAVPGDVIASAETDSAPKMVARTIIEPRSDASPTIPSIVGTVKDHNLVPLPGAKVEVAIEVYGERTVLGEVEVATDGTYTLEIPGVEEFLQHDFAIMVTASAPEHSTQERRAALQSREKKLWRTSFNLPEGIEVTGRVVDQSGKPVGDASVRVLEQDSRSPRMLTLGREVKTWSSGGFRIDVPREGPVRLLATHSEFGAGTVDAGPVSDLRDDEVIEIVLTPTTIVGSVRYPDGSPAANLPIEVKSGGMLSFKMFEYDVSVATDDRGDFEISHVLPGFARFSTSDRNYLRDPELDERLPLIRNLDGNTESSTSARIELGRNLVRLEFTAIRLTIAVELEGYPRSDERLSINGGTPARFSTTLIQGGGVGKSVLSMRVIADPGVALSLDAGERFEVLEGYVIPPVPYEQRIELKAR